MWVYFGAGTQAIARQVAAATQWHTDQQTNQQTNDAVKF